MSSVSEQDGGMTTPEFERLMDAGQGAQSRIRYHIRCRDGEAGPEDGRWTPVMDGEADRAMDALGGMDMGGILLEHGRGRAAEVCQAMLQADAALGRIARAQASMRGAMKEIVQAASKADGGERSES